MWYAAGLCLRLQVDDAALMAIVAGCPALRIVAVDMCDALTETGLTKVRLLSPRLVPA